ncbi:MAG: microviridin/marinostatin family tricyclic proteinase inhibitor [Chitinophagaceae bacterium]
MNQTEVKKPFFVQFLESQQVKRTEDMQEGVTKPWLDIYETHKYPSDSDETDV